MVGEGPVIGIPPLTVSNCLIGNLKMIKSGIWPYITSGPLAQADSVQ